jgi:hypothetical protein
MCAIKKNKNKQKNILEKSTITWNLQFSREKEKRIERERERERDEMKVLEYEILQQKI